MTTTSMSTDPPSATYCVEDADPADAEPRPIRTVAAASAAVAVNLAEALSTVTP